MKGPTEKHFEGIYANPRLMHAIGLVVGCIARLQVKSGSIYEGVLRTISSKADFVLEMAHKVDIKKCTNNSGAAPLNVLTPLTSSDEVIEKIVFKFEDVVQLSFLNVDLDFATRESFTDTAISKFNGQVVERELEPWDGGALPVDGLDLGAGEEEANGWNANDMFRTNEEKYGVKSSFDSNLPGYTIPLNKQNTEEYKQQEARASKIAQEIESGFHHKSRAALENGDEEERFSAVIRPDNANNTNNNFRFVPHRSRKPQNVRSNIRNSPAPHVNRNSHQHSQVFHRVSSPAMSVNNSQGNYKVGNSVSATTCVNTVSPRPTPTSTPPAPRQPTVQANQLPPQQSPSQFNQVPVTSASVSVAQPVVRSTPPTTPTVPQEENHKVNGEADKTELKFAPKPPRSLNLQNAANKEMRDSVVNQQNANKSADRRKEAEKKTPVQKARDDKTEDLKRFHARFKLSEEPKDTHEKDSSPKSESQPSGNSAAPLPPKHQNKEKPKEEDRKTNSTPESRTSPDNPKSSNLNPNAKEFVFNPNAKSFTPRGAPIQNVAPPAVQPPPRLHTQSPIMAMPQPHIMPGMAQTVFNMAPHYVVSATPVSMPVAPPFTPAASVTPAPRFRKDTSHYSRRNFNQNNISRQRNSFQDPEYGVGMGLNQYEDVIFSAMPMTIQRHDMSQPMHVQAATGQPILAQPTLSAPQFTIQYTPPPGMLHHPPGPPQQLAYAQKKMYFQMYSLMPRVLTPQPVGMVPTSAAYGDNPQIPTHVYMPHPGTPGSIPHAMAPSNSGQHSAPSTPQSQTPSLHPAPSPVHQPPPSGGHGQPQTPTGHPSNAPTPQPVMYTHGHMTTQHQLHANHSSSNQGHPFAASYAGTPQPIVLLPQQPHAPHPATFASSLQNHLHGQNPGSHVGTPTHVLPHAPLMIPTSAGLVHTQTAISTGHYVPHSQV
ncbi:ataxin-2-like protein isoform X3 [Argiope bruennichi]|uniref:ataxin-2-like protein isoform X3 n=1 Tax=Argiope bruennichi TaxID=94029 RepID=UPI00249565C8|nr:ataxin-2-like protein isoform X3 [Argiope bruennichi]